MTKALWLAAAAFFAFAGTGQAATISMMIGDNDGYGEGIADNANVVTMTNFPADQRSATEMAATDGSEQTDINSALYAPVSSTALFKFAFVGNLTNAILTLDIGGIQDGVFGSSTLASFNGVLQSGLLALQQGVTGTNVLNFALSAGQLAQANSDGFVSLFLDRNGNSDAIFIDYVALNGNTTSAVPVPASLPLLLAGIGGLVALRRRNRADV